MSMANPNSLIEAIVTALQSISTLTTSPLLASGPSSILPYFTDGPAGQLNLEQSIIEQPPGTILVYWRGTRTGNFNKMESIKHDFGLSLKPKGRAADIFVAIRQGTCTASGLPFKLTQVDPSVRVPEDMKCENSTKYMTERYGFRDFSDITFTLTERGVDN
jgi:hypothetical protein